MQCRICGSPKASYFWAQRQTLCADCHKATPDKASRTWFDTHYWGAESPNVPEPIKRSFYEDYLTSTLTFTQYKEYTTETVE